MLATAHGGDLHLSDFGSNGDRNVDYSLSLWETITGKEIVRFPQKDVVAATFSPNGKTLAMARYYSEGSISLLDFEAQLRDASLQPDKLESRDIEKLWVQLADEESATAYRAIYTLSAAQETAVAFLKSRLQPVSEADGQNIQRLLNRLDDEQFVVREVASRDLKKLAMRFELALRQVQGQVKSLEARRRLDSLSASIKGAKPNPELLRTMRAIQLLEYIGSKEARQILEALAQGTPLAQQTHDAKAALERLNRLANQKTRMTDGGKN